MAIKKHDIIYNNNERVIRIVLIRLKKKVFTCNSTNKNKTR
jgi:hypothetical protein